MKTILFMIHQQPPGQKPISKEQLLVFQSFIAFNRGKVDGAEERDLSGSGQEGVTRALILNWDPSTDFLWRRWRGERASRL